MSARLVPGDRPGSLVLELDGLPQSAVDPADPGWLAFDYVRRLGDVVDLVAPPGTPLRILHVGGGALTLPRYVQATRPGSRQVVLEPDADLIDLVRAELPLPPRHGIKIRAEYGRPGLAGVRDSSQDVVVLDAFDGGRVPADLVSREAIAELRRVLADTGVLVANLSDRAPFRHSRRVLAGLAGPAGVFPELLVSAEPATLRGRRGGNLVVAAGRSLPREALELRARTGAAPYRLLSGDTLRDTLGGGRPFTDADAEAGPLP